MAGMELPAGQIPPARAEGSCAGASIRSMLAYAIKSSGQSAALEIAEAEPFV